MVMYLVLLALADSQRFPLVTWWLVCWCHSNFHLMKLYWTISLILWLNLVNLISTSGKYSDSVLAWNHSFCFPDLVTFAWQWGAQSNLYVPAHCWVLLSWWSHSAKEVTAWKNMKAFDLCSEGRIGHLVQTQVLVLILSTRCCRMQR
jgi:hypothetical protein